MACGFYDEVPFQVEQRLRNMKRYSIKRSIKHIKNTFEDVIDQYADVEKVEVVYKSRKGSKRYFMVDEVDNVWSALGGSSYLVEVNRRNGKSEVTLINCWESGE